jgi:hypothetical protein
MVLVLGALIATFLALIAGRLAWKLALRLGAKRAQRNIPATVVDLQSDRDRLRAEQAILSRKIEVRLDEMKMKLAEQTAEVTRNRNRVETLMQQNADYQNQLTARESEIAMLREMVAKLEKEVADRSLLANDLQSSLDGKEEQIAGLQKTFLNKLEAAEPDFAVSAAEAPSRLNRRIKKLTARKDESEKDKAKQAADDASVNAGDFSNMVVVKPADRLDVEVKPLSPEPIAPAAVASQLESELKRMDDAWDPPESKSEGEAPAQKSGVTNVISLAQRIKALQRDIAG